MIAGHQLILIPADTRVDAPGWRGLRPIHAEAGGMTLRLVIDDLDPDRMPSARDLGGRLSHVEALRWQDVLPAAWDLLTSQPGTAAEEIQAAIGVLTPLRQPPHGQISASSREVFGCVALSPPADGLTLAVTLADEAQHAKLGAILDLVTLTRPDDGRRYYAPWRDDPRPIGGLLQGAYAYLGVSGFWRWQRQADQGAAAAHAHVEFARGRRRSHGCGDPAGQRSADRRLAAPSLWVWPLPCGAGRATRSPRPHCRRPGPTTNSTGWPGCSATAAPAAPASGGRFPRSSR